MKKPKINALVIGVAGGSGSGKTTVVNLICDHFGQQNILRIEHDSYYRDLKHMPFEDRLKQNFDHPASLETDLLIRHLKALLEGYPVHVPQYNFAEHIRSEVHLEVQPTPVILIDGILIFSEPELRDLMDVKIFVDTDDDVRLLRRIQRDISERKRDLNSVLLQYETFVRPMHLKFVEPSKRYADVIIPHGGKNEVAQEMLISMIHRQLDSNSLS